MSIGNSRVKVAPCPMPALWALSRPPISPARVRWEVVKLTCVHLFNATEGASA